MFSWLSDAKKALAAAVGVAVVALQAYHELPFLPQQPVVTAVLGVLTVVATWLAPGPKK